MESYTKIMKNYEASNFGRIRSIDRVVKRDRYTTRKIKGKNTTAVC